MHTDYILTIYIHYTYTHYTYTIYYTQYYMHYTYMTTILYYTILYTLLTEDPLREGGLLQRAGVGQLVAHLEQAFREERKDHVTHLGSG